MLAILNLVDHCSIACMVFKELHNLDRQTTFNIEQYNFYTLIKITGTKNLITRKYMDRQKQSEVQNRDRKKNINEIMKYKLKTKINNIGEA